MPSIANDLFLMHTLSNLAQERRLIRHIIARQSQALREMEKGEAQNLGETPKQRPTELQSPKASEHRATPMRAKLKQLLSSENVQRLRVIRDSVLMKVSRPRTVSHKYGDFQLKVRISDSISASWYDHDWNELPEITFLRGRKLRPGATVFDLGAHQCVVALQFARIVGDAGTTVALEPGLYNYEIALINKKLNGAGNLIIDRAAASDKDGMTAFTDIVNGRVSSGGKLVPCHSVDTLVEKYGKPDVIFVDVEGYECKVLEGAKVSLEKDIDWFVEVHVGCGLESYGGSTDQIVDTFRSAGYSLFYQPDQSYGESFRPLTGALPLDRSFLIATKGPC